MGEVKFYSLKKSGILSKNRLLNGWRLLNGRGYYYGRYGKLLYRASHNLAFSFQMAEKSFHLTK